MIGSWNALRAHTNAADGRADYLSSHLTGVAALAQKHAEFFGSGTVAGLLGRLHDAGKALPARPAVRPLEQRRTSGGNGGVDGSNTGPLGISAWGGCR